VRQTEIDTGDLEPITSGAKERVRRLERENARALGVVMDHCIICIPCEGTIGILPIHPRIKGIVHE
jgi:hypothetical protein